MNLMKTFLVLSLILISFKGSASSELLLDASCRAKCLTSVEEVDADQGGIVYNRVYQIVHFELIGLTRKEIDKNSSGRALELVCKEAFSVVLGGASSECLYFKH